MVQLSTAGQKALDNLLSSAVKEGRLPGLVLAISSVEREIYSGSAGNTVHHDISSSKVTPDTTFWICSMTKLLTALKIAALKLIEEGKLAFDTPISQFFPEFENAIVLQDPYTNPTPTFKPAKNPITVFHLITHTSGLYYGSLDPTASSYILPKAYSTRYESGDTKYTQFFEALKGDFPAIPLVFEPGASYCYGYSSDVLGLVIEKASGQTLEHYLKNTIFEPLGVQTSFHLTEATNARLFNLHFRNPNGTLTLFTDQGPMNQRYPDSVHAYLGGVGLYSTLRDCLTILRHLLQIEAGRNVPDAILKQASVKSLFEPQLGPIAADALTKIMELIYPPAANVSGINWGNGIAVNLEDQEGRRRGGSGWWAGWAGTWFFIDPKTGIALVYGSAVVPPMDPASVEVMDMAERVVYANLEA